MFAPLFTRALEIVPATERGRKLVPVEAALTCGAKTASEWPLRLALPTRLERVSETRCTGVLDCALTVAKFGPPALTRLKRPRTALVIHHDVRHVARVVDEREVVVAVAVMAPIVAAAEEADADEVVVAGPDAVGGIAIAADVEAEAHAAEVDADERVGRKRRPTAIAAAVAPADPCRRPGVAGHPDPALAVDVHPADSDKSPSPTARCRRRPTSSPRRCRPSGHWCREPSRGPARWAARRSRSCRSAPSCPAS